MRDWYIYILCRSAPTRNLLLLFCLHHLRCVWLGNEACVAWKLIEAIGPWQ